MYPSLPSDKTIMIVDDEEEFRETLLELFEDAGFHVIEAKNGNDALAKFQLHKIDLLITDILMPDKEGVELIFELKTRFKFEKIIAMSGGGRQKNLDFLAVAQKIGVYKTYSKPIDIDELLNYVLLLIKTENRVAS